MMHNMKSIHNIPDKNIRSFSGETMTELLFAILITCLGVLIFASMIMASFNLIRTSVSFDTTTRENLDNIERFLAGTNDSNTSTHISISTTSTDVPQRFNMNQEFSNGSGIPVTTYSAGSGNTEIKVYRYD